MLDNVTWLEPVRPYLEPVLIGAAIVFVLDLIGNMISFSNRVLNAFATAVVFAIVFGALLYTEVLKLDVRTDVTTTTSEPATPPPATTP
ncbi:hypothetical protein [Hyphomicrobium sp.]|uniref:hypothetical protein n=1 Tax=Hyphomicrobium sp. TaxID=82 RepID=UPI002D779030|nr:hypothetical protein [Hyphomicrobium sp.]HET6387876.1 hypothetical protein [Hyphomicrobium sp.]